VEPLTSRRAALTGIAALATGSAAGAITHAEIPAESWATRARNLGAELRGEFAFKPGGRCLSLVCLAVDLLIVNAVIHVDPARGQSALTRCQETWAAFFEGLTGRTYAAWKASDGAVSAEVGRLAQSREAPTALDNSPDPDWRPSEAEIASEITRLRRSDLDYLSTLLFESRWIFENRPGVLMASLSDPFIRRVAAVYEENNGPLESYDFKVAVLAPDYEAALRDRSIAVIVTRSRRERKRLVC
jgi:hypothetical protein